MSLSKGFVGVFFLMIDTPILWLASLTISWIWWAGYKKSDTIASKSFCVEVCWKLYPFSLYAYLRLSLNFITTHLISMKPRSHCLDQAASWLRSCWWQLQSLVGFQQCCIHYSVFTTVYALRLINYASFYSGPSLFLQSCCSGVPPIRWDRSCCLVMESQSSLGYVYIFQASIVTRGTIHSRCGRTILWLQFPIRGSVLQPEMAAGPLVNAGFRMLSPLLGISTICVRKWSCIVSMKSCSIFHLAD